MADRLTHYIVVRRDLPFGAIIVNVAHAAGESFYQFAQHAAIAQGQSAGSAMFPGVGSSQLPSGSIPIDRTTAVILGARNEGRLMKLEQALIETNISHLAIREPDAPFNGALMAIGVEPVVRQVDSVLDVMLNEFQLFRTYP